MYGNGNVLTHGIRDIWIYTCIQCLTVMMGTSGWYNNDATGSTLWIDTGYRMDP